MNYIKHLENFFIKITLDDRLSAVHLAIYYSLFHYWNQAKFQNPISICRSELMRTSKVGSANTYTRCLRELHEWGYIDYQPSFNPSRGSLVNLYSFDTSTDNSTATTSDNSTATTSDNGTVIAVRPSINNININKHNKQYSKVELQFDPPTPTPKKRKKFSSDPKIPPLFDEVQTFFQEKSSTSTEAEKFHNYFESNGWLVGGKSKMKNWQAAARNWILNSEKFNTSSNSKPKPGNLNVNQDKDYSIPL